MASPFPLWKAEHDLGLIGECDTRMLLDAWSELRIINFDDFTFYNMIMERKHDAHAVMILREMVNIKRKCAALLRGSMNDRR